MFLTDLNWLGVLSGFLVYFVVGAIWFGPKTFYPAWMRAKGLDPSQPAGSHGPAVVFGMTALGALLQVIAIASVMWFVAQVQGPVGPWGGALIGLLLGIGLAAASSLSHRLFGGDGFRVWAIEVGGDIVGLTLAGLVVGLIG